MSAVQSHSLRMGYVVITAGMLARGRKSLSLAHPIPVVIMAAPPTKRGIRQNHKTSATSYGTSSATTRSHTVTTGVSISATVGVTAKALGGFLEATVKTKLTAAFSKSLTKSKKVTWSKAYTGAHDQDTIVFQGTLHEVYEYVVTRAAPPAAGAKPLVGTTILINDPVATKTFKWTVDHYNKNIPPTAQKVGKTILTHTIGDPKSYRRKAAAAALTTSSFGWSDRGFTVGQGKASNTTAVSITTSNSTANKRTIKVISSAEFKVGAGGLRAIVGGAFGAESGDVYKVTVSTGTKYAGKIGDIDKSDWAKWHYDAGLVVYRANAGSDGVGHKGKLPVHVVSYWTDSLASGY